MRPALQWNGSANDLLELLSALHFAALLSDEKGVPLPFQKLISYAESDLGIKLSKPYDRRMRLAMRKREQTPLLDRLKTTFVKNMQSAGVD